MIFFKGLRQELKRQKNIMIAKEDIRIYGEKNNIETAFLEADEQTLYHLTPNDLGKNIILEPRQSNSMEQFYIYSGMNYQARQFECISFALCVSDCFIRMPEEKLLDYREFYIYRTKKPEKGWFDILEITEKHYSFNNEYRLFKETECIKMGKLIIKEHSLSLVERIKNYSDIEVKRLIEPSIEIIKEKESMFIKV